MSATLRNNAIIWAFATLLMLPAFAIGHIMSDNNFANVSWSEGFAQQLFSGHLYPRWLPEMNAGAGSPVFYFYGPLPFYLTAPFYLFVGKSFAVMLGMWLMLGLSGLAFHSLAATFVRPRTALIASLAYIAMPYHFLVDVWLRSDFGELGAYIFMPLCLLSAFRLPSGQIWTLLLAVSFAGMLLSHLPVALLFSPYLTIFCIYVAAQNKSLAVLVQGAIAAILGFGLAAIYIAPALQLQHLIHAEHWGTYRPVDYLLFARTRYAFELFLDSVVLMMMVLGAIYARGFFANARWHRIAPWIVFSVGAAFVASPAAILLWDALPTIFDKIQFPWRALAMLDIAFCMLFALALDENFLSRTVLVRATLFGLAAITALFFVYQIRKDNYGSMGRWLVYEDKQIAQRVEALEYLPSCRPFQPDDLSDGVTSALIVQRVLKERPPTDLPIFQYPFIDVYSNGKLVPTTCDPKTGFIVVGRHAGPFEVRTHHLEEERAGYLFSLSSMAIVLLGLFIFSRTHLVAAHRDSPLDS